VWLLVEPGDAADDGGVHEEDGDPGRQHEEHAVDPELVHLRVRAVAELGEGVRGLVVAALAAGDRVVRVEVRRVDDEAQHRDHDHANLRCLLVTHVLQLR